MAEYIRVEGVLYHGRVRYASPHGLDRLATFVLERAIAGHGVRSINTLVHSFGLPPRLMQDVLAELLRRGYAALDLSRHELRPVQSAVDRRRYRVSNYAFEVWQDPITGRFLPGPMLDRLSYRPPPGARVVTIRPRPTPHPHPDFIDASSTRIIASLNMVEPSFLASRDDPEEDVDSVVDRDRIGPLDVFVPIDQTKFTSASEDPIEFVVAWGLPGWLSRAWSLALARARGHEQAEVLGVEMAREHVQAVRVRGQSGSRTSTPSVFEEACFLSHYTRWLNAFRNVCAEKPVGDRDGDGEEEDDDAALLEELDSRRALAERLRAAAASGVRFGPPAGAPTHLTGSWNSTRSYLLVTARDWTEAEVRRVIEGSPATPGKRSPYLILPGIEPGTLPQGIDRAELLYPGVYGVTSPDFSLRDSTELIVGSPALLLSDRPALCLTGWSPGTELTQLIRSEEGGWLATELLKQDRTGDKARPATRGGDGANPDRALETIQRMLESLDDLARDLAEARNAALAAARPAAPGSEVDSFRPDPDAGGEATGTADPTPEDASPETDDRSTPALARPTLNLVRRAEDLRVRIHDLDSSSSDDAEGGAGSRPLIIPLHGRSFLDLAIEAFDRCALGQLPRRLEFHLAGPDVTFWENPSAVDLLRRALQAGAKVRLIACPSRPGADPSDAVVVSLVKLRHMLKADGLVLDIGRCSAAIPPGFIFNEGGDDGTHHVAIGSLDLGTDSEDDYSVGFAIQSPPVARAIRLERDTSLREVAEIDAEPLSPP